MKTRPKRHEIIPHTADAGIRVYARGRKELFLNAAKAMFSLMPAAQKSAPGIPRKKYFTVELRANDPEELLVAWLNELLSLADIYRLAFTRFQIKKLGKEFILSFVEGGRISRGRNRKGAEIKAVTYHNLKILQKKGTYEAEVFFDL